MKKSLKDAGELALLGIVLAACYYATGIVGILLGAH